MFDWLAAPADFGPCEACEAFDEPLPAAVIAQVQSAMPEVPLPTTVRVSRESHKEDRAISAPGLLFTTEADETRYCLRNGFPRGDTAWFIVHRPPQGLTITTPPGPVHG